MLQKEKEKCRHDAVVHDLPVVPVGATVTYINKDLSTWSIGRVKSHEGRYYVQSDPLNLLLKYAEIL